MKMLRYHVRFRWEPEDQVYAAWVPSLPGCVTFGKTIEEALEMVRDAIEIYVETLISHGEEVPTDESVIERTIEIQAHA
jgi:antitoxin HicB